MILWAFGLLLVVLALGLPVATALGLLALGFQAFVSDVPIDRMYGEVAWQSMASETLVAIPFFILLGEIVLRAGIAERMYAALVPWLSWLPGGTMHANIGSCALFAAASGSSVATAATIGTVSIGEVDRHGYNERLFLGTLAAGGTLGILIPPSVALIVYGMLTETSVPRLYLAALAPGVLMALLFMGYVVLVCLARPTYGGRAPKAGWPERVARLPDLAPPLLIFAVVVLTIYAGVATPTEAAAFGVVAALGLAAQRGRLTLATLREALEGTMRTTAMVVAIVLTALVLNFAMSFLGVQREIESAVKALALPPVGLMLAVVALYLVLGCFMEGFSIVIVTVPIVVPIVKAAGFDPIWFGVVLTILLETALITPPVGVNLYVVQMVRARGSIADVIMGAAPFVAVMLVLIAVLMAFPALALWLPELVYGR